MNIHPSQVPQRQTLENTPQVLSDPPPRSRASNLRRASIAAFFIAPLIAILPLSRVMVDRVAPQLAEFALTNLEYVFAWREIAPPLDVHDVEAFPEPTPQFVEEPMNDNVVATPRSSTPGPKRLRGIVVRADAVVRAVRAGGRPSSVPSPASNNHPAGLSLVGVSRFGTGLRDGDILTSVGGTPATSEGIVVGVVAGAISQGAKVITGVVWRDDQRLDVAVEIPGPEAFVNKRRRKKSVPD